MIRRHLRPLSAALLATLLCSCGTPRAWFRPAETALTESASGYIAAQYELRDDGQRWGEVRVWSLGARRERKQPTRTTVAIEVENTSDGELELASADVLLKDMEVRGRKIAQLEPLDSSTTRIPANAVAGAHFRFEIPGEVHPDDIDSFRVRWVLTSPKGKKFTQFTTFVPSYYRGYRTHYANPWFYPRFSFGWGFYHHF